MDVSWTYNGDPIATLPLVGYVKGTAVEFALGLVNNGESEIPECYLFVPQEFIGKLYCKRSDTDVTVPLMGPFDPLAYLGALPVGTTEIAFSYFNDSSSLPEAATIPIYVAETTGTDTYQGWAFEYGSGPWASCYQQHVLWRPFYYPETLACVSIGLVPATFKDSFGLWREDLDTELIWRTIL